MDGELRHPARLAEKITEPKPRQRIVLGERTQHDQIGIVPDEGLDRFLLDKVDERFVDDDETFSRGRDTSDMFYVRARNQSAGHTVGRREKDDVAIVLPCAQEPLHREAKAIVERKRQNARLCAGERESIGVFGKGRADNQRLARPQRGAQKINELSRAVADKDLFTAHAVARRQSFFELVAVGSGIARDAGEALDESAARPRRRAERIDAGAEVDKFAGFDASALRPTLDVAAVTSVETRF